MTTAAGATPDTTSAAARPSTRGEQTREHIVHTALGMFRERGYEATTMRAIASQAEVSVGNAYYYFPSKQHLVQAYYDAMQDTHAQAAQTVLAAQAELEPRLRGLLRARIDTMAPERTFAQDLLRHAADPRSPLSPFSPESAAARAASTALYARAVDGAGDLKLPAQLRDALPELLWLYQMGVVLFWVYDTSPGTAKTYLLIDRTVPLVVRLVRLARYRLLRGILDDVLALVRDLRA